MEATNNSTEASSKIVSQGPVKPAEAPAPFVDGSPACAALARGWGMNMSVRQEVVPGLECHGPFLGISRSALAVRVQASLRLHASEYWTRCSTAHGEAVLREHVRDVVTSMPDQDLADLNYLATESDAKALAEHFLWVMNRMNAVRKQINEIAADGANGPADPTA